MEDTSSPYPSRFGLLEIVVRATPLRRRSADKRQPYTAPTGTSPTRYSPANALLPSKGIAPHFSTSFFPSQALSSIDSLWS